MFNLIFSVMMKLCIHYGSLFIPASFICRFDCLVYVEVTPKKDVLAVQEEVQWRLKPPYHHDKVVVKADPGSIIVNSVGRWRSLLIYLRLTSVSNIKPLFSNLSVSLSHGFL